MIQACPNPNDDRPAFPLVRGRFVGLAGLEPAVSSLSEIDGRALCYPAFPQLALIHEWHRDGVNHAHPHPLAIAVYWRAPWLPVGVQVKPPGRVRTVMTIVQRRY